MITAKIPSGTKIRKKTADFKVAADAEDSEAAAGPNVGSDTRGADITQITIRDDYFAYCPGE